MADNGSRTALMVAAFRGRASSRAQPLCSDPWASRLAGEDGAALARQFERINPHFELWLALRTQYLDDRVQRLTSGEQAFDQVVILGAGLDTRAARLARPGLRFFEVDQPHSQAIKRRRLATLSDYPTQAATRVACDFEHQQPGPLLEAAGFRADSPAVVLWEGVVPYLTEPAVRATLGWLGQGIAPRSTVFFDTVSQRLVARRSMREADHQIVDLVEEIGEPLRFGLDDPVPLLSDAGFRHVRSVSFDEICLSLTGAYVRSRAFRFQSIVMASRATLLDP